jgi:hypothetical protein
MTAADLSAALDPDGGVQIDYALGDGGSAVLSYPAATRLLSEACAPADGGTGRLNCGSDFWTVGVYLTVTAGGEDLQSFRRLSVRLKAPGSIDHNPTVTGLTVQPDAGAVQLLAKAPESDSETYAATLRDGGTETWAKGLILSWYVEDGELAHATTVLPDGPADAGRDWPALLANSWTPPSPAHAVESILVLRDTRGGVGWARQSIAADGGTP